MLSCRPSSILRLDFAKLSVEKQWPVSIIPANLYAQWRALTLAPHALHEGEAAPPERLLQGIWFHQRLQREQLRLLDGRRLRVLHPGFWNHEPGPDFRGAVLQFDSGPPRSADVEVDLHSSGWHAHGHDRNPAFHQVALHVVWLAEEKTPLALATLALSPWLDAPLAELSRWLGGELAQEMPAVLAGQCSAPLRGLEPDKLTQLLHQTAQIRLEAKASQFQARARQAG